MATINFNQLFEDLKTGAESVAKNSLQGYVDEAKKDGQEALSSMKVNLQRWAEEVETGVLTREDVTFLIQEETALAKMNALKQAGLAEVQIDKFKNGLINMILGTLTSLVKV